MNANQIITMVIRMVMRRLMRTGVNAGIDAASRRMGGGKAQTNKSVAAPDSGKTTKRARQTMRMARRIGRM